MKKNYEFIEKFLNAEGISGFEDFSIENSIVKVYKNAIKNSVDSIERDGLGSVIAKKGNNPKLKIGFVSHMDEVGFVVQRIEKNGFLRISPVGGHWPHTILAMEVKVINWKKEVFYGVIGSTNVHVLPIEKRSKVMEMKDIYVDLGFENKKSVLEAGINVGDPIVRIGKCRLLASQKHFMARAIDNRISVAILAKVLENIQNTSIDSEAYFVASSQEEVGLRGAKAATQKIKYHLAIAIDTTSSHDVPGIIPGDTKLGKGVAITMKDGTAIANPYFANYLYELALKHDIPVYKYVSQGGGNDSGVTQYSRGGIPVVTIAIPTRYLHTPHEVASLEDFDAVVKLLTVFLKEFNQFQYEAIKYK